MKNTLFLLLTSVFMLTAFSCNNANKTKPDPNTTKEPGIDGEEVTDTKTQTIKILVNPGEAMEVKVDPSSVMGQLSSENGTLLLGNLKSPSNLALKSETVMMTPISMQAAQAPSPVFFEPEDEGLGVLVLSGQYQGDLYEASIVCVCNTPLDKKTFQKLLRGDIYLDDICTP